MTPSQFRALVIGQWLLFFIVVGVAGTSEGLLPVPLRDWVLQERARAYSSSENALAMVSIAYLAMSLMMAIGLLLFQPWAKRMLIPMYALGVILAMFGPPTVQSSIESALEYLMCIMDGAVLATAHLSPVRDYFEAEVEE